MIIEGIIAALVAGAIQLAQAAGQSIQQWINSPAGQQFIQNCYAKWDKKVYRGY